MVRFSNNLIGLLNILTLLISFPILGTGLWFRIHSTSDCERLLQLPFVVLGVFLLVVSLLGLFGACCRVSFLLSIYLFVMFLLIVAMFAFTIVAFVVTNNSVAQAVSGQGYREYKLGNYANWLQRKVADSDNWRKIAGCLKAGKVCGGFEVADVVNAEEFYKKNLSPIQSGCCKPPSICGFTFKNATYWTIPKSGVAASADSDCKAWSNDQQVLCYDCNSCKAGVLAILKNEWKKVAIFNISLLVILIIVYSIGCCAYRNNRADKYQHYRRGYR